MPLESDIRRFSPCDIWVLLVIHQERDALRLELLAAREMEKVRDRKVVASNVLLLRKDALIASELALERRDILLHARFIGLPVDALLGGALLRDAGRKRIEVCDFNRYSLLKDGGCLGLGGQKRRVT